MAAADAPLVWRVHPAQTAALILVVTAVAGLNIYVHPSALVRLATGIIGVAALIAAVGALRLYLVVDDEGIGVRDVFRQHWITWPEVDQIQVVSGVRGASTLRISRHAGSDVVVPPSLLQPLRPTGKDRAMAELAATSLTIRRRGHLA